jgi:tetratricopeptide (TPR) repeat protein
VYCPKCGKQIGAEDRFCSSCGTELPSVENRDENSSDRKIDDPNHQSKRFTKKFWLWFSPIAALILIAGSIIGYYFYEEHITKSALASFERGEELALKGDYEEASEAFQRASHLRPNFPGSKFNAEIVALGIEIEKDLKNAEEALKENKSDSSLQSVQNAEDKLEGYDGKLIDQLKQTIGDVRLTASTTKLKEDMKGKTSLNELDPLLTRAEKLNSPEGKELIEEIISRIANDMYSKANERLKEKQFSDALVAVESGLRYDSENEKLTSLKTTIKKEQDSFEQAEQRRIEEALIAANQERERNMNNAVELIEVAAKMDEYGEQLIVKGKVKSIATEPISSVNVDYKLFNNEKDEIFQNEVYVFPDQLYPGEEGTFEYSHPVDDEKSPEEFQKAKVEVQGFKWYLENN